MSAALIGFLIGVAATYLAMAHENEHADDLQVLVRELKQESVQTGKSTR